MTTTHTRHAELVSASISPHAPSVREARWTLKRVQGDERRVIFGAKIVLTTLAIALAGCDARADWKGWVYPDHNNLTDDIPIGAFVSLEECRKSASKILDRLNIYEDGEKIEGDFECGFKCKAEGGIGGLNVCEKTER